MEMNFKMSRIITNENMPKCPFHRFVYACEGSALCPKWMPLDVFCSKVGGVICNEWKDAPGNCYSCWIAKASDRLAKYYIQTAGFCTL